MPLMASKVGKPQIDGLNLTLAAKGDDFARRTTVCGHGFNVMIGRRRFGEIA